VFSSKTSHTQLFSQHLRRTAGRGDRHALTAALEEWLEALSLLPKNQGRSQAAPIAYGGQPEADKVPRPCTATAYQQKA